MKLYGLMAAIAAIAGMLYGMNSKTIITKVATKAVAFGKGCFSYLDYVSDTKIASNATISLDGYSTASKAIRITVNGEIIDFTTTGTSADDAASIAALINVLPDITSTASGSDIKINSDSGAGVFVTMIYDNADVTATKVTATSDYDFIGVSVFHQSSYADSVGRYDKGDAVAVLTKGFIWVKLAEGANPSIGATAYVGSDGLFTESNSGTTQAGVFQSAAENGLALIEL